MSEYDGTIVFKEWLPDLPALNNPGLTEALNVVPINGTYESYRPLNGTGTDNALAGTVNGAFMSRWGTGTVIYASVDVAAASTNHIYRQLGGGGGWVTTGPLRTPTGPLHTSFAQYDNIVFATDIVNGLSASTIGAASFNAVTIGTAPHHVGVVGQFLVVGNFPNTSTSNAASIRWSAIDNPLSFPDPGSATAIAAQAGDQFFQPERGPVTAISGGDQFGLVFQQGAVNRMTYVGGNTVFQFDTVDAQRGAYFPGSVVKVGDLTYFMAKSGFFVTDGVGVKEISRDKISSTFVSEIVVTNPGRVCGAYDGKRNLIYWAYATSGASAQMQNRLIIYEPASDRFTRASDAVSSIFTSREGLMGLVDTFDGPPMGFMTGGTLGSFSGAPGVATITTGEMEPNPGGYAESFGIKPLVDATLNAVTIAMGTRNDQQATPTFTAEQTANSRSGVANFRTSARYHRARLTLSGTFNAAQGLHYQAEAAGYT